jgi:hypothetical protein
MSHDSFDVDRLTQAHERQEAFLNVGWELSKEIKAGILLNAPLKVARLLEMAFRAGIAFNSLGNEATNRGQRDEDWSPKSLMPQDLPDLVQRCFYRIQIGMGWDDRTRSYKDGTAEGLMLIMPPSDSDIASRCRGRWFNVVGYNAPGFSDKAIMHLVKLGLYEEPYVRDDGWKTTSMTEWGYELFTTGATKLLKDRRPGGSHTYAEFADLASKDRETLFFNVARENGFSEYAIDKQHSVACASPRL